MEYQLEPVMNIYQASRDIQAGEELFIDYLGEVKDPELRKRKLKTVWNITEE